MDITAGSSGDYENGKIDPTQMRGNESVLVSSSQPSVEKRKNNVVLVVEDHYSLSRQIQSIGIEGPGDRLYVIDNLDTQYHVKHFVEELKQENALLPRATTTSHDEFFDTIELQDISHTTPNDSDLSRNEQNQNKSKHDLPLGEAVIGDSSHSIDGFSHSITPKHSKVTITKQPGNFLSSKLSAVTSSLLFKTHSTFEMNGHRLDAGDGVYDEFDPDSAEPHHMVAGKSQTEFVIDDSLAQSQPKTKHFNIFQQFSKKTLMSDPWYPPQAPVVFFRQTSSRFLPFSTPLKHDVIHERPLIHK